jgi:hypothetical protein
MARAHYVNQALGFELTQPGGDWILEETDEQNTEGVSTALILRHSPSDTAVALQVAPAVATPAQLAEQLVLGLRTQPGFTTTNPEPLPMSEGAVGFDFAAGEHVRGRIVVRKGSPGHIFLMRATWPSSASNAVLKTVNDILQSVRPLPVAPERT